jgi:hypothetical protein
MAKAIFAGKKIKEFPDKYRLGFLAPLYAVFMHFPEDFLMGNSPGDAGHRYR